MNDSLPPDVDLVEPAGPSDNEVKSIVALAREQWRLEQLVARLKKDLAEAEQQLKDVAERELPNLMAEIGVEGLPLAGGIQLRLDTEVYASIAEKNREAAHDWLEKNNASDIITREFKIRFNKDDEAWANKFQRDLDKRKKKVNVAVKRAVHPQTLNRWVRESLLAKVTLPEELFGVYRKKVTKLIPPKKEQIL